MNHELLRGASGRLLKGGRFNDAGTRLCLPASTGIACYRGMRDVNGDWTGTLAGIAPDDATAERFLQGAFVELKPG